MTELSRRTPKDIVLSSDYLKLSSDTYSVIKMNTRDGIRARMGEFFPGELNSPTYRMAYYAEAKEAIFEIDDWESSLERQTTYHFKKGAPVLITGYVDYIDNDRDGVKITLYYLDLKFLEDPEIDIEHEEFVKALTANVDDLRIILKLVNNPVENARLLGQLFKLRS